MAKNPEKSPKPSSSAGAIPSWIQPHAQGAVLRVQAQPKASKTEIMGPCEEAGRDTQRLKIRIAAPPVEGEANEELLRFLKKRLRLPGVQLELLRGDSSKTKDVLCLGASPEAVFRALEEK